MDTACVRRELPLAALSRRFRAKLSTALLLASFLWLLRRWSFCCCGCCGCRLGGREEKGRAVAQDVLAARQGAIAVATDDDDTGADAAGRATDGSAARNEERRCSAEQQEAAIVEPSSK